MKKIIFILSLVALTVGVNAQSGRVYSSSYDTLNGNETVNFPIRSTGFTNGYQTLTIQALCTEIGGTSDGTLILQGSVDGTSYVTLQDATDFMYSYPNDTLTITDGAVATWVIIKTPYNYYRIQGGGTASDSTLITPKYVYK
jgi:hypothetical protein